LSDQHSSWQQQLADAVCTLDGLCELLSLQRADLPQALAGGEFPLRVPLSFVRRMRVGDPHDPLLRQILPISAENLNLPGYSFDPVGDLAANADHGIIHKYQGRVLLITTGACAVHCRYCFRRHFPYGALQLSSSKRQQALQYIADDESLTEVILSGGDPLLLQDDKLSRLLDELAAIPHIKRLRIHSRIPVVLPARITPALLRHWRSLNKPLTLVIHANHPQELNAEVANVLCSLKSIGVTLLNQSVLLKDVNDRVDCLQQLSERLFECGVLPYYLHVLDKTQGTGHFEVSERDSLILLAAMQGRLPGYLVPHLVREQAGAPHKIRMS
jgi:L-lysine 2,3-aminomutase